MSVKALLRGYLKTGFWFPAFQSSIEYLHHGSTYWCVNRWLQGQDRDAPAGGSEAVQLLWIAAGLTWLALVNLLPHPVFATGALQAVGLIIVAYHLIIDIFAFALHWAFVADGPLENYRRSLAGFIGNVFEIALFSTIALVVMGCCGTGGRWALLGEQLKSIFQFEPVSCGVSWTCRTIPVATILMGGFLLLIVFANLAGGLSRGEVRRKC